MEHVSGYLKKEQIKAILVDSKGAKAGGFIWGKKENSYEIAGFYTHHSYKPKGALEELREYRYLDIKTLDHKSEISGQQITMHSSDFTTVMALLSLVKDSAVIRFYPDAYVGKAEINIGECNGYKLAYLGIEAKNHNYTYQWIRTQTETMSL